MARETPSVDSGSLLFNAYSCYRRLVEIAAGVRDAEQGLGGMLLYVGELDEQGCAAAIAGNVAGFATLAATGSPEAQKQAIRDGIVDFVVTSLDEALRILKNEIRKKSTVAVCIASSPSSIQREMQERGVAADVTRGDISEDPAEASTEQFRPDPNSPMNSTALVEWSVEAQPLRWLPKLDAIALESLPLSEAWNRRWLQRLPKYLGRVASNRRLLFSDREFAARFIARLRDAYDAQEIGATATICVDSDAGPEVHQLGRVG